VLSDTSERDSGDEGVQGELKKKRTYFCTDSKYRLICEYARLQGRSQSEQVLVSVLAEANRHVPKKGLIELVESIIENYLRKQSRHGEIW